MKKVMLVSAVFSLFLLSACTKKESPQSSTPVVESSEMMEESSEDAKEDAASPKSAGSAIDKEEFLMDDVMDLTEVSNGGEDSPEFTIGYATKNSYEEVKAFYQDLIKKLGVTEVTEQSSDEEETWVIFGSYNGAILQITVGPQEDNRYVLIMSYVQ
ncbi:hypothetical protein [Enterococcus sp.]|uniref:hypothetical protein n=1 Tax=Enterococcus sp. TaxID=35783 RepID=UPI002FCC2A45